MDRKRTLFSKLTGQFFLALASVAVLIAGLIAILLTGWNRRLVMVFLCIGIVTAAASIPNAAGRMSLMNTCRFASNSGWNTRCFSRSSLPITSLLKSDR